MPIDPTVLKKFLVTILLIAGLFFGYQLVTTEDLSEETSSDEYQEEPGYAEEDLEALQDPQLDNIVIDEQMDKKIKFNNSFEHTNPGVSSEIIVNAEGFEPGEFTIVYVKFAGTENYIEAGGQEQVADSDGNISTRFTITEFGEYEVFLSSDGESFTSPVIYVE